jgi:NitT/TauT family transport system ATP-binding protein
MLSSNAFGHYVAQIWTDLREEAGRGMRESEAPAQRATHAQG